MLSFWLSLFATISLTIATPNVTGTWIFDWQNAYMDSAKYSNLTITEINGASQNLSVAWGISKNSVFNMTFVSTNTWVDDSDQDLVYDPTTDTITYYLSSGKVPCLFSRTGSFLSRQDVFGSLSGLWINPTPVNDSTNLSQCCAPTSMSFLSNPMETPQSLSVSLFSSTTNCSSPVPSIGGVFFGDASTQTLVWSDEDSFLFRTKFQISLTPSESLNQLQVMINNTALCNFYYYRSNETQFLDNTWLQDWQTTSLSVQSYQVSKFNGSNVSYMMSVPTLKNGSVYQGYVSQGPNGTYEDSAAIASSDLIYSYDNQTNTLLGLGQGMSFLFSPNGSMFSSAPFINTWYTLDNASIPSYCCVPYSLIISGQENTPNLSITYYFAPNNGSQDECADLFLDPSATTLQSNISTEIPSFTQLLWIDDSYSSQISLNATAASGIRVAKFYGQNHCVFQMSNQSPNPNPNPPNPGPLGASVMLARTVTFILGIFIMFVC